MNMAGQHPIQQGRPRCGGSVALALAAVLVAAEAKATSPEVETLLATLTIKATPALLAAHAGSEPAVVLNADGTIRHLSAPAQHHFAIRATVGSAAQAQGRKFLQDHARAFAGATAAVDYVTTRDRSDQGRHYLRFNQTIAGVPVFCGQVLLQLDEAAGVEYAASYLERNSTDADSLTSSAQPALGADAAAKMALTRFQQETTADAVQVSVPELAWFSPSLLGLSGGLRLAWMMTVNIPSAAWLNARVFLDARSGEVLHRVALGCSGQNRTIFDANNNSSWPFVFPPPVPQRIEGGPTSANGDVNAAYDFIGNTYTFYLNHHGRHGIGGNDQPIFATTHACAINGACPMANSFWSGLPDPPFGRNVPGFAINEGILEFGQGYAVDDVVGHEYTHGVTQFESGLVYENASGAMNEAFSDIWGEFVDLGNGRGTDTAAVRWQVGEDLPGGYIRSMKNPPVKGDPDRLGTNLFVLPLSSTSRGNDYGGVHSNSGVINKLAYLLTDGDTFRGYTISGFGVDRVASLFYEVNVNLLGSSSDYHDLSAALYQAAGNLGWSGADKANVHNACLAVEIVGDWVDRANGNPSPNGCRRPNVATGGPFPTVQQGVAALQSGDPLFVRTGNYNERFTITKPMRMLSYEGSATLGRP